VRLKRLGATGRYVGLCPFHQEKTGSFNVNQARQFYKCFGCGVAGDVLKFVMEIDGLTFPEALKQLAERNGIPMPKRSDFSGAESRMRDALLEMHATAADVFRDNLRGPQGAEARAYLERRGVSQEMIEVFGLGYSGSGWEDLTRRFTGRGIPQDQLEASGLVRRRSEDSGFYDYFRGRLMFPIHNESGKVIGFGGRSMRDEDQPKYLNSPETPIYKKTSVLYNLHRGRDSMRKLNRAVLVEGYMDVIGAYSAGVTEVAASCGTALTPKQVSILHRLADTVVVNFDPDKAGANATEKALQLLLDEGLHVRVLALEGGLDPDEYVKQNGAEVYRAKVESAGGYFHWLADRARARFPKTAEGRADAFRFLLPTVQKIQDKIERAGVADEIAAYLGLDRGLVLDQFKRAAMGAPPQSRAPKPSQSKSAIPAVERILLGSLLGSDEARAEVLPQLTPAMTGDFFTHAIFDALRQVNGLTGPSAFAALEGRLDLASQALLHELSAADGMGDEGSSLEQARNCLRTLETGRDPVSRAIIFGGVEFSRPRLRKRDVDELRARFRAAEREGRMGDARRLYTELNELERRGEDDRGE
jgi:DNA primase